ncbi:NAD(P)/FAD-dependent oxidoreductase [Autumnicola musiva]|uniref:NAD(P)/FAD-dependent oxidoreductase n=1 Tax=Autumnicola musiva TaxID=3075589 RepID=A0ABU3D713_9FLAO|nr:NAD(P)/FAD-dependent oxidoreductase [Zunongwangia sp. F117]MDT0677326.1 NAD(P)/FAD-dependent oxidoreductase [Zunongwangia sp. F117]
MEREKTDVLIIGAGPAGIISAAFLHTNGIKVKVVEKSQFPRFTIGESLIPRVMDNFEEAGLLEVLKNVGFQKKHGARFIKDEKVAEFDFSKKFGKGWDWTWQVPRADFDFILAEAAQRNGVEILFKTTVKEVAFHGKKSLTKIQGKNDDLSEIEADFIIDSSGYGRVLAEKLNLEAPPQIASHSSVFTHVNEINRPAGKEGEQITFEILDTQVWFWYIPFSNGNTSLGFVAPKKWFDKFSNDQKIAFQEMLQLTEYYHGRFDDTDFLFEPVKVENISKNVTRLYGDGFVLTGNSAEFLDPVFSSGVAFATESGLLAAKLILREFKGENIDWQKEYADYMKKGVAVFHTYVKEWYSGNLQKIMFHSAPNEKIKEKICAVLAGYVWNQENPFVKKHERILQNLAKLIEMEGSGN